MSPENREPAVNLEFRTISVQYMVVKKFHIFFILIALQSMQWLKILRKFGSITSTYHKSNILFYLYLSYLKLYRNGSEFKICVWISVFRRKKRFVNPLHGLQVCQFSGTGEFMRSSWNALYITVYITCVHKIKDQNPADITLETIHLQEAIMTGINSKTLNDAK